MTHLTIETVKCPACGSTLRIETDTEKSLKESKEKFEREALLADIARELPPIVFRNWKRWRDIIPMAPRTVANEDSLGKGPKEFVYVGRVKGYPKEAFIDYLRARMRFTESKEAVQLSPRLNVTVRRSGLRSRKIFTQRQRRSREQQVIL